MSVNKSLSQMSPVTREPLVEELAHKVTNIMFKRGPMPVKVFFDTLIKETGYPRADIDLALGRVAYTVLSDGRIGLQ